MAARPRRALVLVVSLALGLVGAALGPLGPTVVHAEPTQADKATARDLLREGKELRAKGDHAGARKKFEAAYTLVPTPITGFAYANELVSLGLLVEAREVLGEVERMPTKSTESDEGRAARKSAEALYQEISPKIPVVEIVIQPGEPQAVLTVDGKPTPVVAAEAGLRLNPGSHVAKAKRGDVERTTTFEATVGEHSKVTIVFEGPSTAPTPPTKPVPAEGAPSAPSPTPAPPPSGGSSTRIVGIVGFGLGVASLGASAILGWSAKSSYDSAKSNHCPTGACTPEGLRGIADARSRGNTATIFFGIGGILAIAGAVVWVASSPSRSEHASTPSLSLSVGPTHVQLGGTF